MMRLWLGTLAAVALMASVHAAELGLPGGPAPANLAPVMERLRQDGHALELLISYGTSKGGSAGHLALAVRDEGGADEHVYSANFYADRKPEHADRYNAELMLRIPKSEYLYGTASSLGPKASFGLDYGEVFKRSVIGVRVYGVPAEERQRLAAFFARINDDFRQRARGTAYHDQEVRYDYLRLNCAKTIGAAFRYGAGYEGLEVTSVRVLDGRRIVAAANANIPTEMAMKLVREWHARGYGMDVVLYRKYPASPYVDPHESEKVAFRDLPNRFPSVVSRDFRREQGEYRDYDNLHAMYLLYNLGRYSITLGADGRLAFELSKDPLPYAEAERLAVQSAREDSRLFRSGKRFGRQGTSIEAVDNPGLYAEPARPRS